MSETLPKSKPKVVYTCPKCGRDLERMNRNKVDKIIGLFFSVRRFKCYGCFWEGIKRYPTSGSN